MQPGPPLNGAAWDEQFPSSEVIGEYFRFLRQNEHIMHTFDVPHPVSTAFTSLMPLNLLSTLCESLCWLKESIFHRAQLVVYARCWIKATTGKIIYPRLGRGILEMGLLATEVGFQRVVSSGHQNTGLRVPPGEWAALANRERFLKNALEPIWWEENLLQKPFGSYIVICELPV